MSDGRQLAFWLVGMALLGLVIWFWQAVVAAGFMLAVSFWLFRRARRT